MTDDSLATVLAEFFDDHGTPNERMRAHYILGRTYADRGEAPAALEAYLDAAASADTTAADCDWAKLSRVHAQSSYIYYEMVQPRSQLYELQMASYYGWRAKDTLIAIECLAQMADAYSLLRKPDSVVKLRETARDLYISAGQHRRAAKTLGSAINAALDCADTAKAKCFITMYEHESGLFDSSGKIERGREIFYYAKGRYFLSTGQLDE